MKLTMAKTPKATSEAGPKRRPNTSGSVRSFMSLSGLAKKMPTRTSDQPMPKGRAKPSQKW